MTEINYTHILLDAIYENSKFTSKFILRECLKANQKHIDNEEFYSSLLNVVKFFEIEIDKIYTRNLNSYYIVLNEDNLLPKENKTDYPKLEIEGVGIPLFQYYNKYSGHIYIDDLIKIKSIIEELKVDNKKNKEKNISAPVIGLFCDIINYLGIIKQGELNKESFCAEVMKKFNINANPNTVRKHYDGFLDLKNSSKNLISLKKLILPNLPEEIKNKVELFIKNQTKSFS